MVKVSYNLSSQMPLLSLIINQGDTKVELAYDNTLFNMESTTDVSVIDDAVKNAPAGWMCVKESSGHSPWSR